MYISKKVFGAIIIILFLVIGFFLVNREGDSVTYESVEVTKAGIQQAKNNGIDFLVREQGANGEFALYMCENVNPEECSPIKSATVAGGIGLMIQDIDDERIEQIKKKIIGVVLKNLDLTPDGKHAVWALYAKNDPLYNRLPADLDDTALMSLFLTEQGVDFPDDREALLEYANNGGLFLNWVSDSWNLSEEGRHRFAGSKPEDFPNKDYFGVDCVVNADVLGYLSSMNEDTTELCVYMTDIIEEKLYPECSFYYRNQYLFFHSLTSAAVDYGAMCLDPLLFSIEEELIKTERGDGTWTANLFSNMAATQVLINLGYKGDVLDRAVANVLASQEKDGGWENAVMFPDLINPVFFSSREMMTAFALQILDTYAKSQ